MSEVKPGPKVIVVDVNRVKILAGELLSIIRKWGLEGKGNGAEIALALDMALYSVARLLERQKS